jgi:phosphosulfolactate synthase (CoM biosynthesis protein A)/phosphosulfolactate phosphohydrolase-like enzyme
MTRAFSDIALPPRSAKPRQHGLTMVLDKNLGLNALADMLETGAHSVDIVKLGWGTSAVQEADLIRRKCALLRQHGVLVCPGGTLTELAWLQGRVARYLDEARALGFSCIEVSDGTVPIPHAEKLALIRQAIGAGFRVTSEVGSKLSEEDQRITLEDRIHQIETELDAGAWKVIMEARESGTQGIFDGNGTTQLDRLHQLTERVNADNLIFEAPLRSQQTDLILTLGNHVNLGNVAPADVIPLETLRTGLRSDTLRHFHMGYPTIRIGLGASAALAASRRGDVVVVVDALRASSTIVTALANGMASVTPVSSVDACVGEVTAGERGGKRVEQLQHDNSPLTFATPFFRGKHLVITTTNGTECMNAASSNPDAVTLVGSLLNAQAVARAALRNARERHSNITIICAGRNNQMANEDLIAASEIALALPGAPVLGDIQPCNSDDFYRDFLASDSGRNLSSLGKTEDVIFCAAKDRYDVVPVLRDGRIRLEDSAESNVRDIARPRSEGTPFAPAQLAA